MRKAIIKTWGFWCWVIGLTVLTSSSTSYTDTTSIIGAFVGRFAVSFLFVGVIYLLIDWFRKDKGTISSTEKE